MPVGHALIAAILELVNYVLDFYVWLLIIGAVLSWLEAFGMVNSYNRLVAVVSGFITSVTEPALSRIRRFLPATGSVDLSPLVLIFIILFLQSFIRHLVVP